MSRKAFHVSVDFDVHAVTCPGVWLCPKGVVMLRIAMFGLSENTKTVKPCFPLLFHERFRFRKLLKSVSSLSCLQEVLKCRNLHMQLVHLAAGPSCCPATVLATFKSPLTEVFYPSTSDRGLNVGVDVDLLLNPASCFPGIISPKVEVSTRVVIEEIVIFPSPQEESWTVNPVTVASKKSGSDKPEDGHRQRTVCHTEGAFIGTAYDCQSCHCYNKRNNAKPPFIVGKVKHDDKTEVIFERNKPTKSKLTVNKRYKPKFSDRTDAVDGLQPMQQQKQGHPCSCYTLRKTNETNICDCVLCKKYNDYFQDYKGDSVDPSTDSSNLERHTRNKKNKKKVQRRMFERQKDTKFQPTVPEPIVKQISARNEDKSTLSHKQSTDLLYDDDYAEETTETHCNQEIPRKSNQNFYAKWKVGTDNVEKQFKESVDCKCGIYSCPDRQRNEACELTRMKHDVGKSRDDISRSSFKQSYRQLFYANLEDYYRKLYERSRERSAIETVGACA